MPTPSDPARKAAGFRRSTLACARAIAGDSALDLSFEAPVRAGAPGRGSADVATAPLAAQDAKARGRGRDGSRDAGRTAGGATAGPATVLPEPAEDAGMDERLETRGRGDAVALHRQHHDARTHARHEPGGDVSRRLYSLAEQARVELLGARAFDGVARNLDAVLQRRYRTLLDTVHLPLQGERGDAGSRLPGSVPERPRLGIDHALPLWLRERAGAELPPAAREALDEWRAYLDGDVAPHADEQDFALDDQDAFAADLTRLLRTLEIEQGEADEQPDTDDDVDEDDEGDDGAEPDSDGTSEADGDPGADDAAEADDGEEGEPGETEDGDGADTDADIADSESPGRSWRTVSDAEAARRATDYRVFTREFDEEVRPQDLCGPEELQRLRRLLDGHLGDLQRSVGRFANRLQRVLMAQQRRAWEFDLEEGQLDTSRLTRLLTDPTVPLTFKRETETAFRDTVVTLLIDNSGSMHGRSIRVAAVCADILSSTLERCGVKAEVLGFTTAAWKGGRSRERWVEAGYPPNPGRLNDLRHIVYKGADTPWRQARPNLGLMMRKGLLKENIDGEALEWAHARLLARPEQRRILMMISDGAPIDDSTLSTNPGRFLERHLRHVIASVEGRGEVELVAIGIGHDVGQYYSRATTINDVSELPVVMSRQLVDLFAETRDKRY